MNREKELRRKIKGYWKRRLKDFEDYKKITKNTNVTKKDILNPIFKQREIVLLEAELKGILSERKRILKIRMDRSLEDYRLDKIFGDFGG